MADILKEILSLYGAQFGARRNCVLLLLGFVLFTLVMTGAIYMPAMENYAPDNIIDNTNCAPEDVKSWAFWTTARVSAALGAYLTVVIALLLPMKKATPKTKAAILVLTALCLFMTTPVLSAIFYYEPLACMTP